MKTNKVQLIICNLHMQYAICNMNMFDVLEFVRNTENGFC